MTPLALRAQAAPARPARRIFRAPLAFKLAIAFLGLVALVLIVNGAVDTYLTYNQAERAALEVESEKARSAAEKVGAFLTEIVNQLGWTVGVEWGYSKLDQQRYDFVRLLRQTPAITALSYIDGHGREQIAVSRLEPDAIGSGKDFSADPRFVRAVADKVWFGPVEFRRGSEPYMTVAVAHVGKAPGVTVADVNLKLVWDVINAIHVGGKGFAYVVDRRGRLIAHPDLSLVLRDTDFSRLPQVAEALKRQDGDETAPLVGAAAIAKSHDGGAVLTAYAIAPKTHWAVFVEQPASEALAVAYGALARALSLLGLGLALAAVSGIALARRMAAPIQALQAGAEKLGAGDLSLRLDIRSGDEIEALAGGFNQMAARLQESYENLEGKVEARTRDLNEALNRQRATSKVLEIIASSPTDAKPVFQAIADSAKIAIHAHSSAIMRVEGDMLHLLAFTSMSPEADAALQASFPMPVTFRLNASSTGKIFVCEDTEAEEGVARDMGRLRGHRAFLIVPLLSRGSVVGTLTVTRANPGSFSPEDISLMTAFADQAVIAIENARLFAEVQERTREVEEALAQQTATADVLKVISRSAFDLQPVLDTLISSAVALIGGFRGAICLRKGDVFPFQATFGETPEMDAWLRDHPAKIGRDSMVGRVALSGRVEQIPDTAEDREHLVPAEDYRSVIGAPLLRDGETIGVVVVVRQPAGSFSGRQIELLQTFADQAVIAIENARLINETRDSLAQQTATANVLQTISRSAFDLDAIFQILVATAVELCGASSGTLCVRDGEVYRYRGMAGSEASPALQRYLEAHPLAVPDRNTAAGRAILSGRTEEIADVLTEEDYAVPLAASGSSARSLLGVPLIGKTQVMGAIVVARAEPGQFPQRHVEILRTFADQAVIAIENSRLFEEVQAKTRDLEESLAQQTATADVLKVISRSAFDLQAVLDTLVMSASQLCGARSGLIFLKENDALHLRSAVKTDDDPFVEELRRHPQRAGRGSIAARVLMTGQVQNVADIQADPDYDAALKLAIRVRGLLGVPLKRNDEVIGAFVIRRDEPGPFDIRHIELVETFADQAVIAVENARLFDEVQARTRELEHSLSDLRKAQDRLVQSEKLASLGQLTAGIAHEIKNPLNFVNNFASLSRDLLEELREAVAKLPDDARADADDLMAMIGSNLEKVAHHGKRADSIVKNMLLHSREGSGERARVNVNAMVEEALNLGYHGARAEKPGFNMTLERDFDPNAGEAEIYFQEITRVLLNLISNGFYASAKRKQSEGPDYEPTLRATTRDLGSSVEIRIRDNGTGIPEEVRAKMFNPFFTTKPAGEGTGLGLSLSHDIVVKQHGGTLDVETEPGAFTEFVITLPRGEKKA